jgi:hypothetical protein
MLLTLITLTLTGTAQAAVRDAPAWWLASSGWRCIHDNESVDWHWGPNHHPRQFGWNGYFGGFQFTLSTWRSTFTSEPHGWTWLHPEAASPAEQRYRAFVNWLRNGRRWGGIQWPVSSRRCGLA